MTENVLHFQKLEPVTEDKRRSATDDTSCPLRTLGHSDFQLVVFLQQTLATLWKKLYTYIQLG